MSTSPKLLSRDSILDLDDSQIQVVEIPEWAGEDGEPVGVRLRALRGTEVMEMISGAGGAGADRGDVALRILIMSAIDDEGNRLFRDEDLPKLRTKNARALMRLQSACLDLNGLGELARERIKNA